MRVAVLLLCPEVTQMHGDHRCLFLVHVKELDKALFKGVAKVHSLFREQTLDVTFL